MAVPAARAVSPAGRAADATHPPVVSPGGHDATAFPAVTRRAERGGPRRGGRTPKTVARAVRRHGVHVRSATTPRRPSAIAPGAATTPAPARTADATTPPVRPGPAAGAPGPEDSAPSRDAGPKTISAAKAASSAVSPVRNAPPRGAGATTSARAVSGAARSVPPLDAAVMPGNTVRAVSRVVVPVGGVPPRRAGTMTRGAARAASRVMGPVGGVRPRGAGTMTHGPVRAALSGPVSRAGRAPARRLVATPREPGPDAGRPPVRVARRLVAALPERGRDAGSTSVPAPARSGGTRRDARAVPSAAAVVRGAASRSSAGAVRRTRPGPGATPVRAYPTT